MPLARPILILTRLVYNAVARSAGSELHVAEFAKKRLGWLYRVLRQHVANNATRYAKNHGYEAVTCGHTHYPEDSEINNVRYMNTGCWTEKDPCAVVVDNDRIVLRGIKNELIYTSSLVGSLYGFVRCLTASSS